jgi:hypothetical protein
VAAAVIVASLLLILVAVMLLVAGLADGSSSLLISSIAASLLAAIALVVGARQAAAARAGGSYLGPPDEQVDVGDYDTGPPPADRVEVINDDVVDDVVAEPAPTVPVPGQDPLAAGRHRSDPFYPPEAEYGNADYDDYDDDEDPPDEPAAQYVTPADAARLAELASEVLVIDGRPRYHLASCVHLLDRDSEPLPVHEAVELGFTPCSLCEPASELLASVHRV